MVKIKFTAQGSNALIGGFSTGDVKTVGEEIGKHLVEEANVAEYVNPADVAAPKKAAPKKGKAASKSSTE